MVNIAIIDYEMGNLKSVNKLLRYLEVKSSITSNPKTIIEADGVILPGVGAFGDAMKHLNEKNLIPVIKQVIRDKKPLLGICLGLQLLFSKSFEMGEFKGLDVIKGTVVKFDNSKVKKIPQIGWNNVDFQKTDHYLIKDVPDHSYFYFVHSFYGVPANRENILGITQYGEYFFASIVFKENVVATQFHPEKSGKNGIKLVKNFVDFCKEHKIS